MTKKKVKPPSKVKKLNISKYVTQKNVFIVIGILIIICAAWIK